MICYLEFTQVIMNPALVCKNKTQRKWCLTVNLINPGMPPLSKAIFQLFILFMKK